MNLHIGFICGIRLYIKWSKNIFQNYIQKKVRCIDTSMFFF